MLFKIIILITSFGTIDYVDSVPMDTKELEENTFYCFTNSSDYTECIEISSLTFDVITSNDWADTFDTYDEMLVVNGEIAIRMSNYQRSQDYFKELKTHL